MLLPGVFWVCSANTVQSEKLIVRGSDLRPLFPQRRGGVVRSHELAQRFSGETFSQRVSLGRGPKAHPAIRVGARRLAQYNDSELLGWKTSAPNLPNGWGVTPPRASTGRAPFSENRFMPVGPKGGVWGGSFRP
jgi:hypothetical protein